MSVLGVYLLTKRSNFEEFVSEIWKVFGGDFTLRVVNMDLNFEERTNKPSMLTDCFTLH